MEQLNPFEEPKEVDELQKQNESRQFLKLRLFEKHFINTVANINYSLCYKDIKNISFLSPKIISFYRMIMNIRKAFFEFRKKQYIYSKKVHRKIIRVDNSTYFKSACDEIKTDYPPMPSDKLISHVNHII